MAVHVASRAEVLVRAAVLASGALAFFAFWHGGGAAAAALFAADSCLAALRAARQPRRAPCPLELSLFALADCGVLALLVAAFPLSVPGAALLAAHQLALVRRRI